jgi:uncharacterized protein (DUF3820 family)
MTDNSIMPYGKHKGQKMANVPPDYLIWIFENSRCTPELAKYIADNLDVIKAEIAIKNKSR